MLFVGLAAAFAREMPKWHDNYHMALTLELPYIPLAIPMSVVSHGNEKGNGTFRKVEYFQGLQQEFHGTEEGDLKFVFRNGERICIKNDAPPGPKGANGHGDGPQFLPDLSTYEYAGRELLDGIWADKYVLNAPHYSPAGDTSAMYDRIKFYYDPVTAKPLKWVMLARNQIMSSHTDMWIATYHEYKKAVYRTILPTECKKKPLLMKFKFQSHGLFQPGPATAFDTSPHLVQNLKKIEQLNAQYEGTNFRANQFLDMHYTEVLRHRTGLKLQPVLRNYAAGVHEPVAEFFDWREVDQIIPRVKDQGMCGSCWAFSLISAVESENAKLTGRMTILPEQAIVDCDWTKESHACDGGFQADAAKDVIERFGGFIPSEEEYGPYLSVDGNCNHDKMDKISGAKIVKWMTVPPRDDHALMHATLEHPSLAVSIAVPEEMVWYESGVLDVASCHVHGLDDLVHAVNLVGYGTHHGKKYWILRNSWSTYWGDEGYIKVARGENDCGVTLLGEYPVVEPLNAQIEVI